jgi:hypothetical protein
LIHDHQRVLIPAGIVGDTDSKKRRSVLLGLAAVGLALAIAAPAGAFDPLVEAQNYNKGSERQTIYDTPSYQTLLFQVSQRNDREAATAQASDPERQFQTDLCARGDNGCAGDAETLAHRAKEAS